jgi:hypothetical protein
MFKSRIAEWFTVVANGGGVKLIVLLVAVFGLAAYAKEKPKPKNTKFAVKGVGWLEIKHTVPGEPIAEPEEVELFLTCAKTKRTARIQVYRMCLFQDWEYEETPKTLYLKMALGRVEPKTGDVKCDRFDTKTVELAKACDIPPPAPTPAKPAH